MIGLILYIPMPGKIFNWHRDFCMMGGRPIIRKPFSKKALLTKYEKMRPERPLVEL